MRERIEHSVKDAISSVGMRRFWGVNSLHPAGRKYFEEVVLPSMLRGEKRSSLDCQKLLYGYEMEFVDEEKISSEGPTVFVMNHWSKGPMRAWWHSCMASDSFRRMRGQDIKWIVQDALELRVGRFHLGQEVPLFSQMQRLLIDAYQLVEVPSAFKGRGRMAMLDVVRRFTKGEVLGLTPELEASTTLKRGSEQAGQLVGLLARKCPDGNLQPAYAMSEGDRLILKFGESRKIGDFADCGYQLVADRVMDEIRKLVPQAVNDC